MEQQGRGGVDQKKESFFLSLITVITGRLEIASLVVCLALKNFYSYFYVNQFLWFHKPYLSHGRVGPWKRKRKEGSQDKTLYLW